MRTTRSLRPAARRGTVLPMVALGLIGLFGFTALAIDLGVLAVSRTDCQNAADVAALAGCRTLNNKPTAVNNDLAKAVTNAKGSATANVHLNANFKSTQIQKVESGQYLYDAPTQQFKVSTWYDVTNDQSSPPPAGSWTAIRVTISFDQPTFFAKVFGITSMPTGATAAAVYRPRDTAFALDMTGSMAYASQFNYSGRSLNPDNLVPIFGHYVGTQANLIATANQANGDGEAISRNNFSITTPGGLPIVRDFYYDTVNEATPATVAHPVNPARLKNAFHCFSGTESGGDATTYTPPTYTFTTYDAFDTTRTNGPTPAPSSFKSMTDSGSTLYVGDRWRRANGSINKTDTTWATGATTTRAAANAVELLGYTYASPNISYGSTNVPEAQFRDLVWEQNGYDLDIVTYRANRGTGAPMTPNPASTAAAGFTPPIATGTYAVPLVPAADRFKGFSMGPGYWGKTFYMWPPDPRWGGGAGTPDPTNPAASGVKDGNSNWIADWRRRFFLNRDGNPFNPQADNNPSTTSGTAGTFLDGINEVLLNSASGLTVSGIGSTSTPNWRINYAAVLKWIKSGPQTLPPNLRAGRVLYYSSIPDNVTTSGTTQADFDKIFWKNYIDYVIGWNATSTAFLYGAGDSWASGTRSITANDLTAWTGPAAAWTTLNHKPYMRYSDNPNRPRLHMWFGPLSMMDFLGKASNWLPGTCHEAQCWQLKAGMNSVIDDVRNNRPNDYIGMVLFAANDYNAPRVSMGQDYNALKNALFYPKPLLSAINGGDTTTEIRPYDINLGSVAGDVIPNANGSTDPVTGLTYAFNLLSPSSLTSTATGPGGYGTLKGRRGASKVVIVETDGVPNTWRGYSSSTSTMVPTKKGFDTYYPPLTWSSGNQGNGHATAQSEAVKVTQQIVKPMATTGNAQGSTADSGLSLPNAPARVYPVGFGDLFDEDLAPGADFRDTAKQFLANIAAAGNTGPTGASTIPDIQIITGPYDQRISRLKDCMERIFETGVSVALVE